MKVNFCSSKFFFFFFFFFFLFKAIVLPNGTGWYEDNAVHICPDGYTAMIDSIDSMASSISFLLHAWIMNWIRFWCALNLQLLQARWAYIFLLERRRKWKAVGWANEPMKHTQKKMKEINKKMCRILTLDLVDGLSLNTNKPIVLKTGGLIWLTGYCAASKLAANIEFLGFGS